MICFLITGGFKLFLSNKFLQPKLKCLDLFSKNIKQVICKAYHNKFKSIHSCKYNRLFITTNSKKFKLKLSLKKFLIYFQNKITNLVFYES